MNNLFFVIYSSLVVPVFLGVVAAEALVLGVTAAVGPGGSLCGVMSVILASAGDLDSLGRTW